MTNLKVELSERSYDIKIGPEAFLLAEKAVRKLEKQNRPVAVITDANIYSLFKDKVQALTKNVIVLKAGEKSKCFSALAQTCSALADFGMDRSGAVFAFGGGVVGDLAGFAASCFMRGVDFFQIPTTLLAMVDSSVGGKTGINIEQGKNLVGAFHQPKGVFIDTDFLKTLPKREFAAGMAEVIKYALLCDEKLFCLLEKAPLTRESPEMSKVIRACCAIKAGVVSADERETAKENGRALLNLGHTFGHAVEKCAGYGEYLHGEAVGLGLVLAARMSERLGLVDSECVARTENIVRMYGLPASLRSPIKPDKLVAASLHDKKNAAGKSKFILLNKIGGAFTRTDIDKSLVREIFKTAQK